MNTYRHDGVEYVLTSEAVRRMPGLRHASDRIHDWHRRRLVTPLAGPDGRPVKTGRQMWWPWTILAEIERRTRAEPAGAPRAAA